MDAPRRPKPMPSPEEAEDYASPDEGGKKDERSLGEFGKGAPFVAGSGKKGSGGGGGGGMSPPRCQAEKCAADLTEAKRYHRRHKVCELHAKASSVLVAGLRQRFCQQCSRFHELSEFDDAKRSCRRRLAGHNERRRKSSSEPHGEGSGCQRLDLQVSENRGRPLIAFPGNSTHKQFRIR